MSDPGICIHVFVLLCEYVSLVVLFLYFVNSTVLSVNFGEYFFLILYDCGDGGNYHVMQFGEEPDTCGTHSANRKLKTT